MINRYQRARARIPSYTELPLTSSPPIGQLTNTFALSHNAIQLSEDAQPLPIRLTLFPL
jgi:hypothetical protein